MVRRIRFSIMEKSLSHLKTSYVMVRLDAKINENEPENNLKTSYVMVRPVAILLDAIITSFKNILCYGSAIRYWR